ncbi:hypothetical protein [Bradyrhizobium liaoningense]
MQTYLQPGILHFPPWGWSNAACHISSRRRCCFRGLRIGRTSVNDPIVPAITEVLPVRALKQHRKRKRRPQGSAA